MALDNLEARNLADLRQLVQTFIEDNRGYAVLTINEFSVGLIKQNDNIYIFNSHSKSAKGNSVMANKGFATVIKFTGTNKQTPILKQIKKFIPKASGQIIAQLFFVKYTESLIGPDSVH